METPRYPTITEVSEQLRTGKASPVKLVRECLDGIDRLNPVLNAFITVTAEQAIRRAQVAEDEIRGGQWRGPLHGVPVAFKDFFDTERIRTTAAFVRFKDRVPVRDAAVVQRLKDAGAIMVGKTNMHELGTGTTSVNSYFGSVHNPWNRNYVAGGSSGGSAAAVATGLCYASVDTDAVGSCRLPAACCGVTGFKGTYGLISTKGILEGEKTDDVILHLSHAAITTRSAEDTALVLNVLADSKMSKGKLKGDYRKALESSKKVLLGIARNYTASKGVRDNFVKAVEVLERSGYSTVDVDVPFGMASFNMASIEEDRRKITALLFKDIDALLLPTTTDSVPTIKAAEAAGPQAVSPNNTFFCNYFSLPAISVPCGQDENNLPLALQIAGPPWGEGVVLDVANSFQKQTRWHLNHPPIV